MIRILSAGPLCSVQDQGRPGFRHLGISEGGALDKQALGYGNLLVGNTLDAAAIEIVAGPLEVAFDSDRWFVITGAAASAGIGTGEPGATETTVTLGWRMQAQAGQQLRITPGANGGATYLSVEGGVDVPGLFNSRSTDIAAGMGGGIGRALRSGDTLQTGKRKGLQKSMGVRQSASDGTIRAIPCPDYLQFESLSRSAFWNTEWRVTPESNRMGCRLQGNSKLVYLGDQSARPSQAVFPGVVQVPPAGDPIVLLADAQTTGGYPVIATVIAADLWKLAQTGAGQCLRFIETDTERAVAALKEQRQVLRQFQSTLKKHGKH